MRFEYFECFDCFESEFPILGQGKIKETKMTNRTKEAFFDRLPDKAETENAEQLRKIVASHINDDGSTTLSVSMNDGTVQHLALLPAVTSSLLNVLELVSSGRGFQTVPIDSELTTQRAADLLNVSRPYLVKLLDEGEIPHVKTGRHRRVRANDLFAYKEKRDETRSNALSELARMDCEAGLI